MAGGLGRRIRAALIDFGLVVLWVGVLAGVVVALRTAGIALTLPPLQLQLLGSAAVLLPVVVGLTLTEGGRYEASPGKQSCGLRVRRLDGRPLGYLRALLRNLIKIVIPAVLAHASIVMLVTGQSGSDVVVLTAIALSLPLSYLLTVCFGEGRGPWDLLCDAHVITVTAGRRFAAD